MELILVRHGQPAWTDPEGRGRNDPGLTDIGHRQARLTAQRLADTEDLPGRGDVDRLFVSPAVRAQETAAPIAEALDLPITTMDWLWEVRNPPDWEGSPIEQVEKAFETMQNRPRDEWWDGHPGGENFGLFHERIRIGLYETLAGLGITPTAERGLWDIEPVEPDLDRIVIVAHAGTNGAIIANLLQVEPEPWEWLRFRNSHTALSVLNPVSVAGHHIWALDQMGDNTHLPVAERTI